jgi:hypothetical protein
MAVDTRNKRASVIGLAAATLLTLPLADASVGTADRPHVAYSYAGIAVESPIIPPDMTRVTDVLVTAPSVAVDIRFDAASMAQDVDVRSASSAVDVKVR